MRSHRNEHPGAWPGSFFINVSEAQTLRLRIIPPSPPMPDSISQRDAGRGTGASEVMVYISWPFWTPNEIELKTPSLRVAFEKTGKPFASH